MSPARSTSAVPFNPTMLRWAREWSHRAPDEAAQKVNTKPENIHSWESGDGAPTVRQARILAAFYGRPFLEFFLPQPPTLPEPELVPDFRMHRHAAGPDEIKRLKEIQSWAEAMRENALDLYSSMGEVPPKIPDTVFYTLDDDPEKAAVKARSVIGPTVEAQLGLATSQALDLPKMIRRALETHGILVLRESKLGKLNARGMCLYSDVLPVIVFGAEAPAAQAFTQIHEFAHITLRLSAISGHITNVSKKSHVSQIENWCDRFAASYLMPADALMKTWAKPNTPVAAVGDDVLQRVANVFKVSRHAMLIRLMHLGYVKPDYYWSIKRPEFEKEEEEYKSFGRAKYYGSRFRNTCGDLYTGLVLDAWASGVITGHNATEYMGTKSFKHLEDIRREFSPA